MLGSGPTASEPADEQTGARLLPAEHLSIEHGYGEENRWPQATQRLTLPAALTCGNLEVGSRPVSLSRGGSPLPAPGWVAMHGGVGGL